MTSKTPGAIPTALLQTLEEGKEVTVQQIRDDFGLDRRQAYNAIARLVSRNFLVWVRQGVLQPTAEGLKAVQSGVSFSSGPNGPTGKVSRPKNTFRQRAWAAMRIRRHFTIGDIVSDAGQGNEKRETENAMRFIRQLRLAGILGELPKRQPGTAIGSNGFKQFILVKNLGPKAPAFRAAENVVHDFNSGKDLPCDRA